MDYEDGYSFTEFRASLHDSQTEGDDLCTEEEVDDIAVVVLFYECSNHSERGETEILEWSGLGSRIEERVEKEGDVCLEEQCAGVVVRGNTLEES